MHIFISYSKKDRDYARQLADQLIKTGFNVWIDDRINYGEDWWQTIVTALKKCAACIVIMSPNSAESRWVQREITIADQLQKPMFPLLLAGELDDVWLIFVRTQYVDVRDGNLPKHHFYQLLSNIIAPGQSRGKDLALSVAERRGIEHKRVSAEANNYRISGLKIISADNVDHLRVTARFRLEHHPGTYQFSLSPDGRFFAFVTYEFMNHERRGLYICVCDALTGSEIKRSSRDDFTPRAGSRAGMSYCWSPDNQRIFAATEDHEIIEWYVSNGFVSRSRMKHSTEIMSLAISPNGNFVASGSNDGQVIIWSERGAKIAELNNGKPDQTASTDNSVRTLAWSPDSLWLVSTHQQEIRIWDVMQRKMNQTISLADHSTSVDTIAWSPDGKWFTAGSDRITLWAWLPHRYLIDPVSWHQKEPYVTRDVKITGGINAIVWHPQSTFFATLSSNSNNLSLTSASTRGQLRIWDVHSKSELAYLEHDQQIEGIAWHPDGDRILSQSLLGSSVLIWSLY